jgi:hypothetical protein
MNSAGPAHSYCATALWALRGSTLGPMRYLRVIDQAGNVSVRSVPKCTEVSLLRDRGDSKEVSTLIF